MPIGSKLPLYVLLRRRVTLKPKMKARRPKRTSSKPKSKLAGLRLRREMMIWKSAVRDLRAFGRVPSSRHQQMTKWAVSAPCWRLNR